MDYIHEHREEKELLKLFYIIPQINDAIKFRNNLNLGLDISNPIETLEPPPITSDMVAKSRMETIYNDYLELVKKVGLEPVEYAYNKLDKYIILLFPEPKHAINERHLGDLEQYIHVYAKKYGGYAVSYNRVDFTKGTFSSLNEAYPTIQSLRNAYPFLPAYILALYLATPNMTDLHAPGYEEALSTQTTQH